MRSLLRHPNYYKKNFTFFLRGKCVSFGDKKIKKSKFYKNKKGFKIYDIDVNKILIPKEEVYGLSKSIKYFIEYNNNDDIRPF